MVEFRFAEWMAKFNKSYDNLAEYNQKLANYIQNDIRLVEHVRDHPEMTYTVAHNYHSDLSEDERLARFQEIEEDDEYDYVVPPMANSELMNLYATNLDWCKKGHCNAIRFQGKCQSCWAFSANAVFESKHSIKHGVLTTASEQQCVSCQNTPSCGGGVQGRCLGTSQTFNGFAHLSEFPYTSGQKGVVPKCSLSKYGNSNKRIRGNVKIGITKYSHSAMFSEIQNGPVWTNLHGSATAFHNYDGGIINSGCDASKLDHGVAVVGYGVTSSGTGYWRIRNSWAKSWGESGYARIIKMGDGDGMCGMY